VLGQTQDSLGHVLDASQAWAGRLTHVSVWAEAIDHHHIREMAKCINSSEEENRFE
jgi:hypothetical protein